MLARLQPWFSLSPDAFWRWGRAVLWGGLVLCVLLLLYLVRVAPEYIPVLPAALLGLTAVVVLFRYPLVNLCVVLAGFSLILDYEAGIQVTEALYGLYCLTFLAHWFVTRLFLYREPVLRRPEAKALFFFLIGVTLTFGLTFVFGGKLRGAFSEWVALLMLAFYFPVREACIRHPKAVKWLLIVLAFVATFVVMRNLMEYRMGLSDAQYAYQIARGRVNTNDNILMAASLMTLLFLLYEQRRKVQVVLLGLFMMFFMGLIFTLSRGYWVAFAFGLFGAFWLLEWKQQKRLFVLGATGAVALGSIAVIFFGDYLALMVGGLIERVSSLGSVSKDLSLLGRYYESKAVMPKIWSNPILGHGMGVEFYWYDILTRVTTHRTFIHNGYLSVWYRFGIWGLGLILFWWGAGVWRGVQVFWMRQARERLRIVGVAAAAVLVAFCLSANTSNPFFLDDTTFVFGILTGLAGGVYERARLERGDDA